MEPFAMKWLAGAFAAACTLGGLLAYGVNRWRRRREGAAQPPPEPHGETPLAPTPGRFARLLAGRPALRGFLWATGSIPVVGLLVFGLAQAAKRRPDRDPVTRGASTPVSSASTAADTEEFAAKAVLLRNPENLEARLALARSYLDRQDFMAVWSETQHVLARSPKEPRALTYQSQVRLAMGQPDVALSMLKSALAADPDLVQAYVYLSFVHLQMGQPREAEAAIAEAVRRFPPEALTLKQGFARMKADAAKQGPIAPIGEANPHAALPMPGAAAHPPVGSNPHK